MCIYEFLFVLFLFTSGIFCTVQFGITGLKLCMDCVESAPNSAVLIVQGFLIEFHLFSWSVQHFIFYHVCVHCYVTVSES